MNGFVYGIIYMITDTIFIPVNNPDLSTLDPSTIGVDSDITEEIIRSRSQPFAFDYNTDTLRLNKTAIFDKGIYGDESFIAPLPNPEQGNQLVYPKLEVGGALMSNQVIIGISGSTKFLSNTTGTYIYNNLNISGIINNSDLIN